MTIDETAWTKIEQLCTHGAHFLPVREKRAMCLWRKKPLSFETFRAFVEAHDCGIAFVPGSLGLAIVDIDKGAPDSITREHPPICTAKTTRGCHLYYEQNNETTGYRFDTGEAQGEVLINNYAVLRSPTTLFYLKKYVNGSVQDAKMPALPRHRQKVVKSGDNLQETQIGERNTTLFNTLRIWAYHNIPKGSDFDDVKGATRRQGQWINQHFPKPLPQKEVNETADSITRFCISPRNTFDGLLSYLEHIKDTDLERYRDMKRNGQKAQAKSRRHKSRVRDKAIMVDLAQGLTQREAAQKHGVSLGTVVKVKKRETATAQPQEPKNTRTKIYAITDMPSVHGLCPVNVPQRIRLKARPEQRDGMSLSWQAKSVATSTVKKDGWVRNPYEKLHLSQVSWLTIGYKTRNSLWTKKGARAGGI